MPRRYRAGESIEDLCRVCKSDRLHTVVAADPEGMPIRVICDHCHSEHNYRGGPRISDAAAGDTSGGSGGPRVWQDRPSVPVVTARATSQTITAPMTMPNPTDDLEQLLRRVIREEAGVTPVAPAAKWRGGTLVLRPATPTLQEKSWPIESFFHKIVMLRNRLRTLEQQVNASELPEDAKLKLQAYVSGCSGTLTSFNVLFADEQDQFKGSGGD
jgi:hypothetical protein